VDRYFAAASATPSVVFPRLLKGARYHARKALDDERRAPTAGWLERQLDEIIAHFGPTRGFPPHLDLTQQGLFVLGYHHQRHWLWMDKDARAKWANDHNVAATAA
jgi:CRISPR-associated protein Csd1